MALYKGRGTEPAQGIRIDGQVWSKTGAGATIRGWVYPTWHMSAEFSHMNDAQRGFIDIFDGLPPIDQQIWEGFGVARGDEPGQALWLCRYHAAFYKAASEV